MKSLRAGWSMGVRGAVAAFLIVGIAGCASSPGGGKAQPAPPAAQTDAGQADSRLCAEAVRAFEEGAYGKARGIFEMGANSSSPEIARRSLYGLAAVRLTTARSAQEYAEAVSLWGRWEKEFSLTSEIEDPRMLTPFLTRISPPSFTEDQPAADKKLKDLENNLGHCRNLLQTRDKDIDTLKSRLDSREKEVRRLRHQLESLEEIHRKYEKQKQEASTP